MVNSGSFSMTSRTIPGSESLEDPPGSYVGGTNFLWRPNLPDEADNHVIELAVAGGASAVVTNNVRDLHPTARVDSAGEVMGTETFAGSGLR
jgi:hypothetical protein